MILYLVYYQKQHKQYPLTYTIPTLSATSRDNGAYQKNIVNYRIIYRQPIK